MTIIQAIVLGILQGATEFIPVSSSGHLVLVPWLFGWEPAGLTFTVVVHVGTVFGVLTFFWQDWLQMLGGSIEWLKTREVTPPFKLLLLLALGAVPAGIIGLAFEDFFSELFEFPAPAAAMLLVTAALLVIGERLGRQEREVDDMTWRDSLFIGVAQALSIMPGISRSGSTIAAGRLRNMKREDAARYSFLLSTPLIIAAGLLQVFELASTGAAVTNITPLVIGFVAAFGSAYLVIRWLLNFLKTRSTVIFAVYCVILSVISLAVWFIRG